MITSYGQLPDGITRVVILDTNAYRDFVKGCSIKEAKDKGGRLKELDRSAGTYALAHPIVIWELLAHLADRNDKDYSVCQKALVALAKHSGTDQGVCYLAPEAATICGALFEREPPAVPSWVPVLAQLATYIGNNAPDLSDQEAQDNFRAFSTSMQESERDWTLKMRDVVWQCKPEEARPVVGCDDPETILRALRGQFSSAAFMDAWAAVTVVIPYAAELRICLTCSEVAEKAQVVKDVFAVSFYVMKRLLDKIATTPSINLEHEDKKRWNFIWDSRIALAVGSSNLVGNAKIQLVTADKEIVKAAQEAGCPDRVLSLEDYLKTVCPRLI